MQRTLSASLSILVLTALYFGMALGYQACGKKKTSDELTTSEKAVQVADAYTQESYFEEDSQTNETDIGENNQPDNVNNVKQDDPAAVDYTAPANQSRSTTSGTSSGKYFVIAGNYLVKSNAEDMVNKLKREGFKSADMAVFDLSQYYTVLAGRFDNRSYANSVSSELKSLGIDNYVLTKSD